MMTKTRDKAAGTTGEYMALPIVSFRAFCRHFPGHGEARTLWAILLLTYENYKLQGLISISQLQQLTALSKQRVIDCLQSLEAQGIITINKTPGETNTIRFQKDPGKWVVHKKSRLYLKRIQDIKEKYRKNAIRIIEDKLSDDADKG
jgi:DNA-binding transcriptional regulator GbsR (MarR family)